jgi:hypothetical protein
MTGGPLCPWRGSSCQCGQEDGRVRACEGEGGEGVWDSAAEAKRMAGAGAIGAGRAALQQRRGLLVAVAGGSRVVVGRRVGGGHQEGMAERSQVAGRRYQWMDASAWGMGCRG